MERFNCIMFHGYAEALTAGVCPYCGAVHVHGCDDETDPGCRVSHCRDGHGGEYRLRVVATIDGGYPGDAGVRAMLEEQKKFMEEGIYGDEESKN